MTGGYRNDTLHRNNSIKFSRTESESDTIHIKHIHLWQVGVDYFFTLPQNYYRSNCLHFLKNFYVDGFAYGGAGGRDAPLHETITSHPSGMEERGKAKLKAAHTTDLQVGIGYVFDWNNWAIGCKGGYSYNKQTISTEYGKCVLPKHPCEYDLLYRHGYRTSTIWQGPWLGAEIFYACNRWKVRGGYEYHFTSYIANHYVPDLVAIEYDALEDKTFSNRASGNVIFLNGVYHFCEGWEAGLWLKYQHWSSPPGHLKPRYGTFSDYELPATTKAKGTDRWISYSISLDLGYFF